MPTAFVLINAEIGGEEEVLTSLKKIQGIEEAYMVYGVYDIIAKIKAKTHDELTKVITLRIRRLNKVRSTSTMIVIE